jgi:hypothetical protein
LSSRHVWSCRPPEQPTHHTHMEGWRPQSDSTAACRARALLPPRPLPHGASSLAPHRRDGILPRLVYLSARAPPESTNPITACARASASGSSLGFESQRVIIERVCSSDRRVYTCDLRVTSPKNATMPRAAALVSCGGPAQRAYLLDNSVAHTAAVLAHTCFLSLPTANAAQRKKMVA